MRLNCVVIGLSRVVMRVSCVVIGLGHLQYLYKLYDILVYNGWLKGLTAMVSIKN